MKYYLAYGSNLSVDQMRVRCPNAIPVGTAVLKNWGLRFRYHATIEQRVGYEVPVGVWLIDDSDEQALDFYEGYPHYYEKQTLEVTVYLFNNKTRKVNAMVYTMKPGHAHEPPDHAYYNGIREGYNDFGLDGAPLWQALYESTFLLPFIT